MDHEAEEVTMKGQAMTGVAMTIKHYMLFINILTSKIVDSIFHFLVICIELFSPVLSSRKQVKFLRMQTHLIGVKRNLFKIWRRCVLSMELQGKRHHSVS